MGRVPNDMYGMPLSAICGGTSQTTCVGSVGVLWETSWIQASSAA
jgi:hypothetical protein